MDIELKPRDQMSSQKGHTPADQQSHRKRINNQPAEQRVTSYTLRIDRTQGPDNSTRVTSQSPSVAITNRSNARRLRNSTIPLHNIEYRSEYHNCQFSIRPKAACVSGSEA